MSSALLTQAVSSGDESAVSALLASGANVNERTSGGQTPLILATIFGHTHLVPLLLKAGADPHLRDNLGLNAIDWAQRRGASDAIQLFNNFNNKDTPVADPTEPEVSNASEPVAPPPSKAGEKARPASEGEKSQRWLAGLKQRIAEQSQPEVPDGTNIFRAQPERPAAEPSRTEPAIAQPEPRPTKIEVTLATPKVEETKPAPPAAAKENPPTKPTRKRCPKCGETYNSDLVAYCAHHVVELVDADEPPIISEPAKTSSPALLWMIVAITLTGSIVVGSFFLNRTTPQTGTAQTTTAATRAVQKGVPLVDPDLQNKATSLPIAECPLNGQEAIPGTVVVKVVINKDGHVTAARASGGDWLLRGAASEAAMKSTFSPEKLRGRETEGTITYTFEP